MNLKQLVIAIFAGGMILGTGWYMGYTMKPVPVELLNRTQPALPEKENTTLIFADVTDSTEHKKEKEKEYQALMTYLSEKLSAYGITKCRFESTRNLVEMAKLIRRGRVDVYIDSAFPAFVVARLANADPVLNRWKQGTEKYRSIIFTKHDSGIVSLDNLKGKTIAFRGPSSTTGYLLPKSHLLNIGYRLTEKSTPHETVKPDEIGYYFFGTKDRLLDAVIQGIVQAGAYNTVDIHKYLSRNDRTRDDITILSTTMEVYRHFVLVRKGIDTKLKEGLVNTLLEMESIPQGRKVLESCARTKRFSTFGNNKENAFHGIRTLAELIEDEIIRQ